MDRDKKRHINIIFGKAGNGTGAKINLSIPLLKEMGVTQSNRRVTISYNDNEIIISKAKK